MILILMKFSTKIIQVKLYTRENETNFTLAGMDFTPILMYPDVKEFVYVDQLPKSALCEYGIIYI